jgi:hypothetical protein
MLHVTATAKESKQAKNSGFWLLFALLAAYTGFPGIMAVIAMAMPLMVCYNKLYICPCIVCNKYNQKFNQGGAP